MIIDVQASVTIIDEQVCAIIAGQVSAIIIARPLMTRELVLHPVMGDTRVRLVVMRQSLVGGQGALDLSSLSH